MPLAVVWLHLYFESPFPRDPTDLALNSRRRSDLPLWNEFGKDRAAVSGSVRVSSARADEDLGVVETSETRSDTLRYLQTLYLQIRDDSVD